MARNPQHDDDFARESFTFRRMARWQVVSISIVAILTVAGLLLAYVLN